MSRRISSSLFFLLSLYCALAPFSITARADAAITATPVYRIQAGDTLAVVLWNEEQNAQEVVVNAEGAISYPLAGMIDVKGLTLAEAGQQIAAALKDKIKHPRVTVSLKAARAQGVYILGAVAKPGTLPLDQELRLMDVLGLVGGLLPDADAAHVTLTRAGKTPSTLDLTKLIEQGDPASNITLQPGDTILIPARKDSLNVFILGQVNNPGSHPIPLGSRLSDAILVAGGPSTAAGLQKATLSREGLTVNVDLDAILRKGDLSGNIPLKDRDVILIPAAHNEITLLGEFLKPGAYPFPEGSKLTDALPLGGGLTADADPRLALLKRDGKEIPVDLEALLKQGQADKNLALQDGDTFLIPTGIQIYTYGALQKPGSVTLKQGTTLIDVLVASGGARERAQLDKAGVVRIVNGKPQVLPLNIKNAIEQGGSDRNFQFAKDDVLVIPEKGKSFNWQTVIGTLTSLTVLGLNPLNPR